MHYVKHFDINGIDTKQVACIELHGKPNAATEGHVGVLGIDVDSSTHDVYKCVAVNGSIYTWELLSSGLSVMSAYGSRGGELSARFTFGELMMPPTYVVKIGDLILDREGYVYQVTALGSSYCNVQYCGIYLHGKSGVWVGDTAPTDDSNVWINPNGTDATILRVKKADGSWANVPAIKGDKGDQGDKGDRGKSAYEYAREGGYAGTEAQFAKVIVDASVTTTKTDKRVTNLERSVYGDLAREVVDDSVARVKDVPTNAKPYARIDAVGGMTRKCTNLLDIPDATCSGAIAYNAILLGNFALAAGTYTLSVKYSHTGSLNGNISIRRYTNEHLKNITIPANTSGEVNGTFTLDDSTEGITVFLYSNITPTAGEASVSISKVMLNSGDTALPYEPYFEGLRSAPTEKVESVGANLFDKSKAINVTETDTGFSFTWTGEETAPNIIGKLKDIAPQLKVGDYVTFYSNVTNASIVYPNGFLYLGGSKTDWVGGRFITITQADLDGQAYAYGKKDMLCEYANFRITKIANAPYSPYQYNTLPIPEAVQALDGYGEGVNESVYNYIDYEKKQFVKKVKKVVFDGSENWARYSDSDSIRGVGYCYALRITNKKAKGMSNCSHFNRVTMAWDFGKIGDYCDGNSDLNVYFVTSETTVEEWKSRLAANPITLVYELAEPIVTDISDILPADNYIGVEGGGTLTMVNEYGYDVPSEVVFVTKEVTE